MKALVLNEPGALAIEERDTPEPGPGEVRVQMHHGGICGSDIHYFLHGGFGAVRMKAPMVLGHELAGVVDRTGPDVRGLEPGTRVAVNPSLACGACAFCNGGMPRLCSDMRFMGSAMRTPHVDGGFREHLICRGEQTVPVGDDVPLAEVAVAEPLAVCLHAVVQGGDVRDRRVLVTGFGPIGALTLLAARQAGAHEIAVADIAAGPLALARTLEADAVYDVSEPGALDAEKENRGQFDVVFECAGHPSSIEQALDVTRPGGTVVQVGMTPGTVPFAVNTLIVKEITLRGTFRFDAEFDRAVGLIATRAIDVRPVISRHFPLAEAKAAFACAMDRSQAIKVLLDFG